MSTTGQGSTMAVSSEVATSSHGKEGVSYTHLPTQSLIVVEDIELSHSLIGKSDWDYFKLLLCFRGWGRRMELGNGQAWTPCSQHNKGWEVELLGCAAGTIIPTHWTRKC